MGTDPVLVQKIDEGQQCTMYVARYHVQVNITLFLF